MLGETCSVLRGNQQPTSRTAASVAICTAPSASTEILVAFLLTAKRDLEAAERFFCKMLKDEPLLSPGKFVTDGANTFSSAIKTSIENGLSGLGLMCSIEVVAMRQPTLDAKTDWP